MYVYIYLPICLFMYLFVSLFINFLIYFSSLAESNKNMPELCCLLKFLGISWAGVAYGRKCLGSSHDWTTGSG